MKQIVGLLAAVFLSGCGASGASAPSTPTKPSLENLLVDFGRCPTQPCSSGRGGAFVFSPMGDAPLLFGSRIQGPDGLKTIPNLEFRVASDADVRTPVAGTVAVLQRHEGAGDFTLRLEQKDGYTIEIDHLLEPQVAVGDVLVAGQVLGKPGDWGGGEIGRVELQVNHDRKYVCPMDYLAPALAAALSEQVTALMQDWEEVTDKPDLYDQAAMVTPGCVKHAYTDAEL